MGQEMLLNGKNGTAKVFTHNVDDVTVGQIVNFLNQDFVAGETVRIMPDTHAGKGSVIGTTMTVTDKVVPNLVGVDIGCGVLAYKLDVTQELTKDDLKKLDGVIYKHVPNGSQVNNSYSPFAKRFERMLDSVIAPFDKNRVMLSMGSLGGGNHFIELNRSDKDGSYYLVVHSGSRNLGVKVATYHQNKAVENMSDGNSIIEATIAKLKAEGQHKEIESAIKRVKESLKATAVPKELAYLKGQAMSDYLNDLEIAQEFAKWNRHDMLERICTAMGWKTLEVIESVHNFLDTGDMILRKGATPSYSGQKLIVPINMRDGSIIAVGKGNKDWNYSAPHGAGRIMSRSKAKAELDLEDFQQTMGGIVTTSVSKATLDEAPMVYKPLEEIVENTKDTMDILEVIRPVYNFKAGE